MSHLYGPVSAIPNDELFDRIVNQIDSTRSGESTGWSIIRDCRDPARATVGSPLPIGFRTIQRKSDKFLPTNISYTNINLSSDTYFVPGFLMKDPIGIYYLYGHLDNVSNIDFYQSLVYCTSNDGINFGNFLIPETVSINASNHYGSPALSTLYCPQGNGSTHRFCAYIKSDLPDTLYVAPDAGTSYGLHLFNGPATANYSLNFMGQASTISKMYAFSEYSYKCNFFVTNQSLTAVYKFLIGSTSLATWQDHNHPGTNKGSFENQLSLSSISASSIGVNKIYEVDFITYDPSLSKYRMFLSVENSAGQIGIMEVRYNDIETLSGLSLPYGQEFITELGTTSLAYTYRMTATHASQGSGAGGALARPTGIDQVICVSTDTSTGYVTGNISDIILESKSYSNASGGGVDGNKDYNDLEYEYVVFKSDYTVGSGNGYYFILLQPNTAQVSPPSVIGITDRKPIFLRPIRKWDMSTNQPLRFLFDPIIPSSKDPTTIDALGPCIFSIPDPTDSPSETHKMWLKVNDRQVFIFTETSGGNSGISSQYLHYNVLNTVIPLDNSNPVFANDNVLASSAGDTNNKASIIVGKNGRDELNDVRLTGNSYYPLVAQVSYSSVLQGQNSVDNKSYSFPLYAVSDAVIDLDGTPSPSLDYMAGTSYQTLSYSNFGSMLTGDTVTFGSDTYKVFRAKPSPSAKLSSDTPDDLLVLWA